MSLPRLLPAYAKDHPVLDLGTAETFVVATARLWAAPHRDPWQPHPDWRGGFRAAGVAGEGEHAFDTLFWIVLAGGHRGLDVRCPRCPRLGDDEGWLLQIVGYGQLGRTELVELALESWLPPAAARAATVHASLFARTLMSTGLVLPLGQRSPRRSPAPIAILHAASPVVH